MCHTIHQKNGDSESKSESGNNDASEATQMTNGDEAEDVEDNALVQSIVQDFARGAATRALTVTKAERDQRNVERVRHYLVASCQH